MNEQSLFISAVECESEAQLAALLDRAELSNEQRLRMRRLLHAHRQSHEFLSTPAPEILSDIGQSNDPAPESGQTIGPYKLLEQIGEGGMGIVYLADQQSPVRRKVAVKVIKPGMDTRQVIARFEAERQALAMMDHSGIARVFDAGATESGRPYFVMELVRGVPLTDYCQKEECSLEQRLALFIDVCRAVQHAHLKGIIHRDIKPSNVMVALHDGTPVVKMIDFGIAKAMNQQLTERTLFTNSSQMLGTPMYMSPEQAEVSGLDVDTRSDVYSLGVLLYELLTDDTPFEKVRMREAGCDELRRIIREEDPPRPSTRFNSTHVPGATPTVNNRSKINHRELGSALQGELDWIILRAMEKSRTRRYQSAQELADDLLRFLDGKAVEARPPSIGYRTGKLLARHRTLAIFLISLACLMLLTTTVSTAFAIRAFRAESLAETAQGRAETDAAIATRVSSFLSEELLSHASPYVTPHRDLTVREVLDRASSQIDGHFTDQPLVEANLRTTIGTAYRHLGRYRESEHHLRRAGSLLEASYGRNHQETLRSEYQLAVTRTHLHGARETIPQWKSILAGQRQILGNEAPDTLITMGWLAYAHALERQFSEAESLFAVANAGFEKVLGSEHPETLDCLDGMARMFTYQGRHEEAENLHQRLLATRRRVLGENHPQYLDSLSAMADVSLARGKKDEAVALYSELVETRRKVEGESHPRTLMDSRNMGRALEKTNRLEDARGMYLETLKSELEVYGPDDSRTVWTMQRLASLRETLGEFPEAIELHREILDSRRGTLGDQHEDTFKAMQNLAVVLLNAGESEEALQIQSDVVELLTFLHTRNDARTVSATIRQMHGLQEAGRFDDALRIGEDLLQRQSSEFGRDHETTLAVMLQLAYTCKKSRQLQRAEALFREVQQRHAVLFGERDPTALRAGNQLAVVLRYEDRLSEAEVVARTVLETRILAFGEQHPDTLESLSDLTYILDSQSKTSEAVLLYDRIIPIRRLISGDSNPLTREEFFRTEYLGEKLSAAGRHQEASHAYEMLWKHSQEILGRADAISLGSLSNAVAALEKTENPDWEKVRTLRSDELSQLRQSNAAPERLAECLFRICHSLDMQGRLAEAEPLLQECLKLCKLSDRQPSELELHASRLMERMKPKDR